MEEKKRGNTTNTKKATSKTKTQKPRTQEIMPV
jgi:hypothetical protein